MEVNITDDQIDALWRFACGTSLRDVDPDLMHLCTVAVNRLGDYNLVEQHLARRQVEEIIRERAKGL